MIIKSYDSYCKFIKESRPLKSNLGSISVPRFLELCTIILYH